MFWDNNVKFTLDNPSKTASYIRPMSLLEQKDQEPLMVRSATFLYMSLLILIPATVAAMKFMG